MLPKARTTYLTMAASFIAVLLVVVTCDMARKNKYPGVVHYSGEEFAGSESCTTCHTAIAESHKHTPHFLTSTLATKATVMGSFDSAKNVFELTESIRIVMEKTDTGLLQRGFVGGRNVANKRMDLAIGSGRKGQTYLYWDNNALFQLPVSYHAAGDQWNNSPGYPTDRLVFDRSIPARCIECHATFAKIGKVTGGMETFVRDQIMLGVDCERCHGPAANHVDFHKRNPGEKSGKRIINPARLTRKQKLDNCALCHSGIRENLMPSFSYIVGQNLDDYSYATISADSGATLDVHGNQYGLLLASKCFKESDMDCSSCHNVHTKETGNLQLFSSRCMTCHVRGGENFCKQHELPGLALEKNCIDCHMPALPSRQIFSRQSGGAMPAQFFVRTHLISTYDEKIKAYLQSITTSNGGPD